MAGKINTFSMGAILVFGMAIGAMSLLLGGMQYGIFVFNSEIETQNTESLTPGTDQLNSFSRRQGQRKQVYFGGIEDNYSTAELEPAKVSPERVVFHNSRIGRQGAVEFTRQYDEAGVDNFLIDEFEVNGIIARGIVVLKSRSLVI